MNADVNEPRGVVLRSCEDRQEFALSDLKAVAEVLPAYVQLRKEGYGTEPSIRMSLAKSRFRDDPATVTRYLRVYEAAK